MNFSEIMAAWTFALFSLAILSYLWKLNYVYKIAETFAVGSYLAHSFINTWSGSIEGICLQPLLAGEVVRIIPLIFGLLIFTRLSRPYAWISRYPTALLAGVGTGVMFGATFDAQILTQLGMTAQAFIDKDILSALVILVGGFATLTYFIYTQEHTGALGISARLGRVFAMFSFGMNYAAELIWYLTLVVGIIIRLVDLWIKGAILGL
jgi:hypothetical protein